MRCKTCKDKFEPKTFLQKNCLQNPDCIQAELEHKKKVAQKSWNKEKKQRNEALKTNSDYVRELQVVFNKFIRLRDKDKGCISCSKPLIGKYDAGHFYSVGSYPELRFHEMNNNGQCVYCNQHQRGNIHEYNTGIVKRWGVDVLNILQAKRGIPRKYTEGELKGLKVMYKLKIKALCQ